MKLFGLYLALFHLHLMMDYYGSGVGWFIAYLWPASNWKWKNPNAWEFISWQNTGVFLGLLGWTIVIAYKKHRTPLESIAPRLDQKCVGALVRRRTYSCETK
jgi:hypothetical protein